MEYGDRKQMNSHVKSENGKCYEKNKDKRMGESWIEATLLRSVVREGRLVRPLRLLTKGGNGVRGPGEERSGWVVSVKALLCGACWVNYRQQGVQRAWNTVSEKETGELRLDESGD